MIVIITCGMCERIKRECYQNASGKAKSKTTRFSPLHVFLTLALLIVFTN